MKNEIPTRPFVFRQPSIACPRVNRIRYQIDAFRFRVAMHPKNILFAQNRSRARRVPFQVVPIFGRLPDMFANRPHVFCGLRVPKILHEHIVNGAVVGTVKTCWQFIVGVGPRLEES